MNFAREMTLKFKRETIANLLEQCNEKERQGFVRIWPNGIASIPEHVLDSTINLCHRTLRVRAPLDAATEHKP